MENEPDRDERAPEPSAVPPAPDAARAALDDVAATRAAVAERMRHGPRWYDAVYGAACGLLVLSLGLPQPWLIVGLVVAVAAFAALITSYRAATGIALGAGDRPWGTVVVLGVVLVASAVASWLDGRHGLYWGVVLVAVLAAVVAWALSRRYTAELIAALEDDDEAAAHDDHTAGEGPA